MKPEVFALIALSSAGTAFAQSFRPLPPLDPAAKPAGSFATGVSADGRTVVGTSFVRTDAGTQARAFRWQLGAGITELGVPAFALEASAGGRVSDDGSIVVGTNGFTITGFYEPRNAMRWTEADTANPSPTVFEQGYFASDLSADGLVMVGTTRVAGVPWPIMDQAFRWTKEGGFQNLGLLDGGSYSAAAACSADGAVIAGYGDHVAGTITAMRWTSDTGMTPIPGLALGTPSQANGMSRDGRFITGRWGSDLFRFTEGSGSEVLGILAGAGFTEGLDVSADGSTIVGYSDVDGAQVATIWTSASGITTLFDYASGFGLDLSAWSLLSATGISDDGQTIVGYGLNPGGSLRGFVIHIPGTGASLTLALGLVAGPRRRR